MPRFEVGHEKRVSTGFSVSPKVLADAKAKAGRTPLSSIIEALLQGWIEGAYTISEKPVTAEITA